MVTLPGRSHMHDAQIFEKRMLKYYRIEKEVYNDKSLMDMEAKLAYPTLKTILYVYKDRRRTNGRDPTYKQKWDTADRTDPEVWRVLWYGLDKLKEIEDIYIKPYKEWRWDDWLRLKRCIYSHYDKIRKQKSQRQELDFLGISTE